MAWSFNWWTDNNSYIPDFARMYGMDTNGSFALINRQVYEYLKNKGVIYGFTNCNVYIFAIGSNVHSSGGPSGRLYSVNYPLYTDFIQSNNSRDFFNNDKNSTTITERGITWRKTYSHGVDGISAYMPHSILCIVEELSTNRYYPIWFDGYRPSGVPITSSLTSYYLTRTELGNLGNSVVFNAVDQNYNSLRDGLYINLIKKADKTELNASNSKVRPEYTTPYTKGTADYASIKSTLTAVNKRLNS